jgi:hypothetical protein
MRFFLILALFGTILAVVLVASNLLDGLTQAILANADSTSSAPTGASPSTGEPSSAPHYADTDPFAPYRLDYGARGFVYED